MLLQLEAVLRQLRQNDSRAANPVWTTLEVAKLAVATATPLMIFAVGAFLSHQASDQALAQQKQASELARKREAADNDRQVRLASMTSLVTKRISALDEILPAMEEVNGYAMASCGAAPPPDAVRRAAGVQLAQAHELMRRLAVSRVYFSHSFYAREVAFIAAATNVRSMNQDRAVWARVHSKVCEQAAASFEDLMKRIPLELGNLKDPQTAVQPGMAAVTDSSGN
jgi:hypothetical protein